MRKKLFGLVPLLAITAFAVIPAAAQAAPHWYKQSKLLGAAPTTITTKGKIVLTSTSTVFKCKITDGEEIFNPVGGGAGQDLITSITFTACKAKPLSSASGCFTGTATVVPTGLPWASELLAGTPIRDEIRLKILISCSAGTVPEEIGGALTPEVGNGVLIFGGAGGGTLTDPFSNPVLVTGKDKLLGPPGKGKITSQDP